MRLRGSRLVAIGMSLMPVAGMGCSDPTAHHVLHLVFQPDDLYEPVVKDEYFLNAPGSDREYAFETRYCDIYELGLRRKGGDIPASYRYAGRLSVEIVINNEMRERLDIVKSESHAYSDSGSGGYKRISLATFPLPPNCSDGNPVSIRVSVIEPEVIDDPLADSLEVYVRVSATP
jgi:hypothetical protein